MQKAIIHTNSRVIRRLTVDVTPSIASDESVVELSDAVDLAGGFFKLDPANKLVPASKAEIDAADVDESKVAAKRAQVRKAIKDAIIDIADNGATQPRLNVYFQALKDLK